MNRTCFFLFSLLIVFAITACDSSTGSSNVDCGENPIHSGCNPELTGTLYYTHSSTFKRYDFDTQDETSLFSETGADYTLSYDGSEFIWYESVSDQVHIQDTETAAGKVLISLPYDIESVPISAPGTDLLVALVLASNENGECCNYDRRDLVLFDREGNTIASMRHVTDFAFLPNGRDIVVSLETLDSGGNVTGYAVVLFRDYQTETPEIVTIREFDNYDELPVGLSVSPDNRILAYTYNFHLYTIPLGIDADPRQMTTSDLKEFEAGWSPDGQYLIFRFTEGVSCGVITIIPFHSDSAPIHVTPGGSDDPADLHYPFPYQPVDNDGLTLPSCGARMYWRP